MINPNYQTIEDKLAPDNTNCNYNNKTNNIEVSDQCNGCLRIK